MLVRASEKNKMGRNIQVGVRDQLLFYPAPEKVSKNLKIKELSL